MQWLIDMVIEAIGIPPTYIDRGDAAGYDFTILDFTTDGAWHDLDLSAIVPEKAKGVAITIIAASAIVAVSFHLRKKGHINTFNTAAFQTQVGAVAFVADLMIGCNNDRVIQYRLSNVVWNIAFLTVKGWWL